MSPVPRRRRYYEGATTSHPASRSLLVRDRVPRGPPGFVLAEALPGGWRSRPSLGRLVRRRPGSGWRPRGRGGISQVPRRSIPCLCPAPRPRPNQWSLTEAVPPMLPPHPTRRRLQRSHDLEAATGLQHPLPTLRTRSCRRRARLASGWLVGLCRERVELSGSRRKVSERSHVVLLSRAYPVASWVHAQRLVP